MASLSLYAQFKTNLMSIRKVIILLLQLKAHGKNNMKVKPQLVRHLSRNCLLSMVNDAEVNTSVWQASRLVSPRI